MTRDEAVALVATEWWKGLPDDVVAGFQLFEERLCMPFGDFHGAVEKALGRSVWTHEFASPEHLRDEFLGKAERPSFQQILDLIPAEKRIVVEVPE